MEYMHKKFVDNEITQDEYYKMLVGHHNEIDLFEKMYRSFECNLESEANKQGYSYRYTLVDGRIVRR